MKATEESLHKGIEEVREGNRLHDVSHAIQAHVEAEGFSVVRDFVGHGIGRYLHEEPQIPNFGVPGTGVRLRKGMVLAIEPMINAALIGKQCSEWLSTFERGLPTHYNYDLIYACTQEYISRGKPGKTRFKLLPDILGIIAFGSTEYLSFTKNLKSIMDKGGIKLNGSHDM